MTKLPITEERRGNGLRSYGADIRPLMAPVLGKTGFLQADLLARWTDIFGPALAQGVFPEKVVFSRDKSKGAVLQVKTVSGAFATEITARSAEILERLNSYFGYAAFSGLRVAQGAVPPPKKRPAKAFPVSPERKAAAEEQTAAIGDEDLRRALIELGTFAGLKK